MKKRNQRTQQLTSNAKSQPIAEKTNLSIRSIANVSKKKNNPNSKNEEPEILGKDIDLMNYTDL